jgi:hypothetical protein
MSTAQDVDGVLAFLEETFIAQNDSGYASSNGNDFAALGKPEVKERACACSKRCQHSLQMGAV